MYRQWMSSLPGHVTKAPLSWLAIPGTVDCLFQWLLLLYDRVQDVEGGFTFERIHNTKEQIYFYERAENHKAKERLFESFKWANFPGKLSGKGVYMYKRCWFRFVHLSHLS